MKRKDKKKNTKKKVGFLKTIRFIVPYIIKSAPLLFFIGCAVLLLQAGVQSLQIYLLEDVFNGAEALAAGKITVKALILLIVGYVGTFVLTQCVSPVANYVDTKFNQISARRQKMDMYAKTARLEPIIFEDTDMLDDIEKANNGVDGARNFVATLKNILLNQLPYIAVTAVYMLQREPLLMFVMVLIFAPTLFQQFIVNKLYVKKEDSAAPLRRKTTHYGECMTSPQYYKETRILGAFRYFISHYRRLSHELIKIDVCTRNKQEILYTVSTVISLAGKLSVYYLLFIFLMNGRISVGEFAAVFTSLGVIEGRLHSLFYDSISGLSQSLPSLENYIRFLWLPMERAPEREVPSFCDIELSDVRFSYPNQEGFAVDGVNLKISPRETVAIVGENGSGKSTLIKLLTGYYVPTEGNVTYNGVSTSEMSFSSVAKHLSAVYQRYPSYAMTLKENILLGQTDKVPTDENLRHACAMAGFSPEEEWLTCGFDTMLSREFDDGVGLSGGQQQRISIARAFYRDSDIIVLDEPTAAIDPIEEARVYGRFAELSRDRTALIVTHRLASVKIADRIVMMKNGRAVEIGTHDELMALDGEYRHMYDSQRQWYEDGMEG
ncbi:MAG: ABC transporter ATP-binding protein [Clostridia bacterium]|nr:ABC transporter ATP-binding protein [Clostridia bacterium]